MLKTGIKVLNVALFKLFNLILQSGSFPSSWCNGIINPIFKSGNKRDPVNYRGICTNSCLGKLFTSFLNTRLKTHVVDQNILHKAQIGFLPGHRTSDHIFSQRTLVGRYVKHGPKGKWFSQNWLLLRRQTLLAEAYPCHPRHLQFQLNPHMLREANEPNISSALLFLWANGLSS